jgi:integrase
MALYKIPGNPLWQIRFKVAGRTVRRSAGTRDKRQAQELEKKLKDDAWRQQKLGERRWMWLDAVERFREENRSQPGWRRQEQCIAVLNEYLSDELLSAVDYDTLLALRKSLSARPCSGNGWKTRRTWKPATVNRVLAVAGAILERAASDDWRCMIPRAPNIPLYEQAKKAEPRWITREQAHKLLAQLPEHSADLTRMALATGLRRSNVTGLEWSRIDFARRCCYVVGYESKTGEPIPIPLNAEALAVIERWKGRHPVYVFCVTVRGKVHAPIYQVTTRAWREACKAVGLEGVTFHSMRHSWASWQTQAGTPPRQLQELGGWADLQMPMRYSHLDPGHLEQYADRTLIGEGAGAEKGRDGIPESVLATESQQPPTDSKRK